MWEVPQKGCSHKDYGKHESYNDAQSTASWPVIFDSYKGFTLPVSAWEGEIIGVSTDGTKTTYPFCHNWSSATALNSGSDAFRSGPRGNVSQDGIWFAFTSDLQINGSSLQGTSRVGVGSTSGTATCTVSGTGNCRHDVFICDLK